MSHRGELSPLLIPARKGVGSGSSSHRGSGLRWSWWRVLRLLCILLGSTSLLLASGSVSSANSALIPKFYYFNPDSTQVNFHDLQQEIKKFFLVNGLEVEFQPFARFRDFDQQVKKAKPSFLFLPSWYLDRLDAPKGISPLLIPIRQGQETYTKLLMTSKASGIGPQNLARKTIALTSFASDEQAMLDKILFHRLGVVAADMSYVHASKDLDALIAVAVNQVALAFVSRESIDRLHQVNPRLADGLTSLAESDPIPLPVLCYSPEIVSPELLVAFKRVVLQGEGNTQTRTIKKILQIDDWKATTK